MSAHDHTPAPTEPTGFALASTLLSRIGDGGTPSDAPIVHRCRCGEQVPDRLDICATCAAAELEELRRMALAKARATLPSMPHAHLANPRLGDTVDARILAVVGLTVTDRWSPLEGSNLVLLGDTGAGKTTAAVAVARAILDRAKTPEQVRLAQGLRFVTAPQLHTAQSSHAAGGFEAQARGEDAPIVAKAKATALLILDEVGFEPAPRRDTAAVVVDVIQGRYIAGLPTIVTSGLTEDGLVRRYGEATKRRICGRARVVATFDARKAGAA